MPIRRRAAASRNSRIPPGTAGVPPASREARPCAAVGAVPVLPELPPPPASRNGAPASRNGAPASRNGAPASRNIEP